MSVLCATFVTTLLLIAKCLNGAPATNVTAEIVQIKQHVLPGLQVAKEDLVSGYHQQSALHTIMHACTTLIQLKDLPKFTLETFNQMIDPILSILAYKETLNTTGAEYKVYDAIVKDVCHWVRCNHYRHGKL